MQRGDHIHAIGHALISDGLAHTGIHKLHALLETQLLGDLLGSRHQLSAGFNANHQPHRATVCKLLRLEKPVLDHETQIRLACTVVGQGDGHGVALGQALRQHIPQRLFNELEQVIHLL